VGCGGISRTNLTKNRGLRTYRKGRVSMVLKKKNQGEIGNGGTGVKESLGEKKSDMQS